MPRPVDAEDRRREIAHAAIRLIATRGFSGLTLRAVAAELNGSLTLVTHYYSSRAALLEDIALQLISEYDEDLVRLEEAVEDPWQRLGLFVDWLLPTDDQAVQEEAARIILAAETRSHHPGIQSVLNTWDQAMRSSLSERISAVVEDPADVAQLTDILRVFTNGVVLTVVEHPDEWPPERQRATLAQCLRMLDLDKAVVSR